MYTEGPAFNLSQVMKSKTVTGQNMAATKLEGDTDYDRVRKYSATQVPLCIISVIDS